MEAKEVRIGNYVYDTIREDIIKIQLPYLAYMETCNPILLTEEWFEKFGFKIYGKNDYHDSPSDWYWCKIGFDFSIAYKTKKVQHINNKLKYVHQLQNLYFALTGEELELSLNVA